MTICPTCNSLVFPLLPAICEECLTIVTVHDTYPADEFDDEETHDYNDSMDGDHASALESVYGPDDY